MPRPRRVPPAPSVLAHLYMEYIRRGKPVGLTFRQYLHAIGFVDPAVDVDGMDDGAVARPAGVGLELIAVPTRPVVGRLRIVVLLVDFPDRPGTRPATEFRDLLFSDRSFPTGSLRDFYREVSGGKVDVDGAVHGWLRMPQRYSYYTNNESGMGANSYPRNAQRLAEHAVGKAVAAGVPFPADLDALGEHAVTGLFVVHAGPGAETFRPPLGNAHVWSHKWNLRTPIAVGRDLSAATYLTVPEDCRMGVCAHELGHLAFQWEDFYDPNGGDDGVQWAGTGRWDLMAGGSWNGDGGNRPAHPIGLHKSQHGWVTTTTLTASKTGVTLPPYTPTGGAVVKVVSPAYGPGQFLLLENRQRTGFDDRLPGDGLLVWRVDLARDQTGPSRPAVQLVQADGRQDLENSSQLNQGDAGDPFPGLSRVTRAGDVGVVSTSFPGGRRSGVTLSNVAVNPTTHVVTLNITIQAAPAPAPHRPGGLESIGPEATDVVPEVGTVPAPPASPYRAGLANLLRQPEITPTALAPLVQAVTPTLLDVERYALALPPVEGERDERAGGLESTEDDPAGFGGWVWRRYLGNVHPEWPRLGTFEGGYSLEIKGPREYLYVPKADPFRFTRANGEVVTPRGMITDGGSVPWAAGVIRDVNPWGYMHAFVLHDWLFMVHHCLTTDPQNATNSFASANLVLAEAIYTLMRTEPGKYAADWRKVVAVHSAVSSFVGQGVWNPPVGWGPDRCRVGLPGEFPPGG